MATPYTTAAAVRSSDKSGQFSDPTMWPEADIDAQIALAELEMERCVGVAFTPRVSTDMFDGLSLEFSSDMRRVLHLTWPMVRSLTSCTVDDVDVSGWMLRRGAGVVTLPIAPVAGAFVVLTYEHGLDTPPPEIVEACQTLTRHRLSQRVLGAAGASTRFQVSEGGTYFALERPGPRKTGIDAVDAVLAGCPYWQPGFA